MDDGVITKKRSVFRGFGTRQPVLTDIGINFFLLDIPLNYIFFSPLQKMWL